MNVLPAKTDRVARNRPSLELKLDDPGTLRPPGPVGRLVRLGWGLFLSLAVYSLWTNRGDLVGSAFPIQPFWWLGSLLLLSVFPYVINIGFGVSWGAWPRRFLIAAMALGVAASLLLYGSPWSAPLGWFVIVWQLYAATHLGASFLTAAAIATPGCEMRALPHLWTLASGRETKEHYCPGHIDTVDRWELSRRQGNAGGPEAPRERDPR